jgi:hypothetical protein
VAVALSAIIRWSPDPPEVGNMCHESWSRRERREERFDEQLRYLLDEEAERSEAPRPVVEHERDEQPMKPERLRVEAGTR